MLFFFTSLSRPSQQPDVKALLARLQALEDVQASQASRLTDLDRQAFLFLVQHITTLEAQDAELEARITDLERSRHRKRKPKLPEKDG